MTIGNMTNNNMKSTTKIEVDKSILHQVTGDIKKSRVKFHSYRILDLDRYQIELEIKDSPLLAYLLLKYDGIKVIQKS